LDPPARPRRLPRVLRSFDDEHREPLRIVVILSLDFELVDDAQVRLVRAGVDHAPGRPVRAAKLACTEHCPVSVTSWK